MIKLLICSLVLFSTVLPGVVVAESVKGLTLTPATKQITIASGSGQTAVAFEVSNYSTATQNLTFHLTDFSADRLSDGAAQLNIDNAGHDNRYGLINWANLEQHSATLKPGESQVVTVRINDDNSLIAGGHYGALVVLGSVSQSTSAGHYVALSQSINGLIFLTKTGGEVYGLNLSNVESSGSLLAQSPILSMRFQNTGNVHTVPRGIAQVFDPRGRLISQGVINEDSDLILPQTNRLERIQLISVSKANMIGRYHLNVQYHRDGDDNVLSSSVYFFYVPPYLVVLGILFVFGIGVLLLRKRLRLRKK